MHPELPFHQPELRPARPAQGFSSAGVRAIATIGKAGTYALDGQKSASRVQSPSPRHGNDVGRPALIGLAFPRTNLALRLTHRSPDASRLVVPDLLQALSEWPTIRPELGNPGVIEDCAIIEA
jgi:hypothetical protein